MGLGRGCVAASDPIPTPADQFLVVGAEEGIYTLNLHELHEDTLEKVRPLGSGGQRHRGPGADRLSTAFGPSSSPSAAPGSTV